MQKEESKTQGFSGLLRVAVTLLTAFCLGASCDEERLAPTPDEPLKGPGSVSENQDADGDENTQRVATKTAPEHRPPSDLELRVREAIRRYPARKLARSLGGEAVPVLLSALQDEREMTRWKRITALLGHIGDEAALAPLVDFMEKQTGVLPERKCHELGGIPFAIGLIAAGGSDEAYDYLRTHLREDDWDHLKWTCEYRRTTPEKQRWYFARKTIVGMAITGREDAVDELQKLLAEKAALPDSNEKRQMVELVEEALRQIERIRKDGLDNYFDRESNREDGHE